MSLEVIIYLQLSAHLIGDYYLQSGTIAQRKTKSYCYTLLHSLFYGIPYYCLWGFYAWDPHMELYVHICAWSHLLIDMGKVWVLRSMEKPTILSKFDHRLIYLIDQMLHIAIIIFLAIGLQAELLQAECLLIDSKLWGLCLLLLFAYQPYYITLGVFTRSTSMSNTFSTQDLMQKLMPVALVLLFWWFPWICCLLVVGYVFLYKRKRPVQQLPITFFVIALLCVLIKV